MMERICHVWNDGKDMTCIVVDTQISVLMRHLWKDDEKLPDDVPKSCCFPTSKSSCASWKGGPGCWLCIQSASRPQGPDEPPGGKPCTTSLMTVTPNDTMPKISGTGMIFSGVGIKAGFRHYTLYISSYHLRWNVHRQMPEHQMTHVIRKFVATI